MKKKDDENVDENEKKDDDNVYVTVLLGETLARLTCMYFQATVHRVVRYPNLTENEERYSLPFQLRGSTQAFIDSVKLNSPLYSIPHYLREPVKIGDFIT